MTAVVELGRQRWELRDLTSELLEAWAALEVERQLAPAEGPEVAGDFARREAELIARTARTAPIKRGASGAPATQSLIAALIETPETAAAIAEQLRNHARMQLWSA